MAMCLKIALACMILQDFSSPTVEKLMEISRTVMKFPAMKMVSREVHTPLLCRLEHTVSLLVLENSMQCLYTLYYVAVTIILVSREYFCLWRRSSMVGQYSSILPNIRINKSGGKKMELITCLLFRRYQGCQKLFFVLFCFTVYSVLSFSPCFEKLLRHL